MLKRIPIEIAYWTVAGIFWTLGWIDYAVCLIKKWENVMIKIKLEGKPLEGEEIIVVDNHRLIIDGKVKAVGPGMISRIEQTEGGEVICMTSEKYADRH